MKTLTACTALLATLTLAACQQAGDGTQTADAGAPAAGDEGSDAATSSGEVTEANLRAGLWQVNISMAESARDAPTLRMCTDGTSTAVASSSQLPDVEDCSQDYSRTGRGLEFTSRCQQADGTVTETSGTITGDFETSYRMEATVTTSGSAVAGLNRTDRVVTTASYQGACPADWRPGDVEVAGTGIRMNSNQMQEGVNIDPDQLREMVQRRAGR